MFHFDTGRHGAGQDRALAENGKYLAGHAGDETDNLVIAEDESTLSVYGQANETGAPA